MSLDKSVTYEALFELSQAISGHSDLDSLCQALAKSLKRIFCFDYLVLLLHDGSSNSLRMHGVASEEAFNEKDLNERTQFLALPVKDNPIGWVWETQEPLLISQIDFETRWTSFLETVHERGLSSAILVPLTTGGRRLGVLAFGFKSSFTANQEELAFINRVASELSVTIDSYLTKQQYLSQRDRLQLLFDVTNALVSNLHPEALLAAIFEQLNKVVATDFVVLTLLDTQTGELVIKGIHFTDPQLKNVNLIRAARPDGLPSAEALSSGKPVIIDEPDFKRFPSSLYRQFVDAGFRSSVSIPLISPNGTLGTLELARSSGRRFIDDDIELLVQVARQIAIALENSLEYRELAETKERLTVEKLYLEDEINFDRNLGDMLGESLAFQAVLENVKIVGPTDATVLILGETGTGKELIARAIHQKSRRSGNSFIKVNCAAIPSSLLESELFGHEKGAFTGALARRIGKFELANHGTLFLDEIGEIPLELQPKLLRAIQEQEFERLGGNGTMKVDVRFVAASNRNLKAMVEAGAFRNDLYYRLHVFPLVAPPLRDRREDIPLLTRYFTQRYARRIGRRIDSISKEALNILIRYDWPGNVRELQNIIERSVILSRDRTLELAGTEILADLPEAMPNPQVEQAGERERILQALKDSKWKIAGPTGAAYRLGLKRTTLHARMKKLKIKRDYI